MLFTSVVLETPTPAVPPNASPPAKSWRFAVSEAPIVTLPPASTVEPCPAPPSTYAAVSSLAEEPITSTRIEPEMPASPAPPAEAATNVICSLEVASIVTSPTA